MQTILNSWRVQLHVNFALKTHQEGLFLLAMTDTLPQSMQIFAMVLLVGGAAAWGVIELRIWSGKPVLPYEPRRLVPWNGIDLLLTLFIYLGSQAVCLTAALRWVGDEDSFTEIVGTPQGQLAVLASAAVSGVLTFVCSAALVAVRAGAHSTDLGLDAKAFPRDTVYGIVAFLAAAPVVYLIQYLFVTVVRIEYEHPLIEVLQERSDPAAIGIVLVIAIVVAPLVEEFLVRVLLQGWLEKIEIQVTQPLGLEHQVNDSLGALNSSEQPAGCSLPDVAAHSTATTGLAGLPLGAIPILTSSLLFSLMHFGQGAAPVPLFFYALVLGYLYQRTHRIWPSLVAHFALNSVSMGMLFLSPLPGAN